jgi:hypothetical protein
MLWVDMGLGKTVIDLTASVRLFDYGRIRSKVIFAPKRVCETVWRKEAKKWDHTSWLQFSAMLGTKEQRLDAMHDPADIYLVNYDNTAWFAAEVQKRWLDKGRRPPFDAYTFDEISKLKSSRIRQGGVWGKHLQKILRFVDWRSGLTGTPASNGLLDLFGQFLIIDGGQRFGEAFGKWREALFGAVDFDQRKWKPLEGTREWIGQAIGDITISMNADDYLDMPPFIENDIWLDLGPKLQYQYDQIEREMLVRLASGAEVECFNEGSRVNRCLQFANGGMYLTPGAPAWEEIHRIKIEALVDIMEEAAGAPVLLAYEFVHDAERILKHFPGSVWFNADLNEAQVQQVILDWNAGKIPLLFGHPASIGHGIDELQNAGYILAWFGLNWSRDLYDQLNARLRRQGQKRPVMLHRILMRNTLDEAQVESLDRKQRDELSIRETVMHYAEAKARLLAA